MRRGAIAGFGLGLIAALTACPEPSGLPPQGSGSTSAASTGSSGALGSGSPDSGSTDAESGPAPGLGESLIEPEAWQPIAAEDDPLAAERPDEALCDLGWGEEVGAFEVDTELCLYGAFAQPTLAEIHAGDTLEMLLLHDALYATEPAMAHLAIAFGTELAWEIELPIPSDPGIVRPSWTAPRDVPQGAPVHFHVHNHGANNYRLIALTVASP